MRPNLFDFAPSELSQDAFLSWILAYADHERGESRPAIKALGREFLSAIFNKDHATAPPAQVDSVAVSRQVCGIDILCVVNGTIAIVLEDKVGTTEHSGQLDAYSRNVEKLGFSEAGKRIVRIYLQTGNQSSYKQVRDSGYHVFSRVDLLALLEAPAGLFARERSDIVEDFWCRLQRIEGEVQSYRELPPERWSANARMGLFMVLQDAFPKARWRYVAGGLYAFYWCGGTCALDGCEPYLQIEAASGRLVLCFKISIHRASDLRARRERWHRDLIAGAAQVGLHVSAPQRFGSGSTMTVGIIGDFPVKDAAGVVDLAGTVSTMRKAESELKVTQISRWSGQSKFEVAM